MDPKSKLTFYLQNKEESFQDFISTLPQTKRYYYYDTFSNSGVGMNKVALQENAIQVFSDEWLLKRDIVKRKLLKEGFSCGARTCQIKPISSGDKNAFLEKYHIQGADRATIKLGLFKDGELIGCATFTKSFRIKSNPENIWELSRYASSMSIVGGLRKVLKYVYTHYNINIIDTFADLRWSQRASNLYLSSGFVELGLTPPCYFYSSNNTERIHRFNCRKGELIKKLGAEQVELKTEKEIMYSLGYNRIQDAGSIKYRMTKSQFMSLP